jgi:hypothetical protein
MTTNQGVTGSNPVWCTSNFRRLWLFCCSRFFVCVRKFLTRPMVSNSCSVKLIRLVGLKFVAFIYPHRANTSFNGSFIKRTGQFLDLYRLILTEAEEK